jgi:hypothetical protein
LLLLVWRLILLPTRLGSRGREMVVHVDADAPGGDRSNTRIKSRINPWTTAFSHVCPSRIAPPAPAAVVRESRRESRQQI